MQCRSLAYLLFIGCLAVPFPSTLKELAELGVGFLSVTEAPDMTTATGRAMAGLMAVLLRSNTICSGSACGPDLLKPN
jgi:hypothetical protein